MPNPVSDYPQTTHTPQDTSVFSGSPLGATTPTHTQVEGKQEETIAKLTEKVGVGESNASDATTGQVLTKNADGSTTWEDAQFDSELRSDFEEHAGDTLNPHEVTAAQIGALTEETDPVWESEKGGYQKIDASNSPEISISRDGNGVVNQWTVAGTVYTPTYTAGVLTSYTDGTSTWTISRDGNNRITGVTKT